MKPVSVVSVCVAALMAEGLPRSAFAHPHAFIDAKEQLLFDKDRLIAIRHVWLFDERLSANAFRALNRENNGRPGEAALVDLAKANVESLAAKGFFTHLTAGGTNVATGAAIDYRMEIVGNRLTLAVTLPLETPIESKGRTTLSVFDPTYVVGFRFGPEAKVEMVGAPSSCVSALPRQTLDPATTARLSNLPLDLKELPPDLKSAAALANTFIITCE